MTQLSETRATRLAQARWRDTRLLLGVLLVLVSVVLGARLLGGDHGRVRVWAVTHDLGAATPLTRHDLVATSVDLAGATGQYLSAGQDPDGLVVTRPVGRGELLPAAAVGRPSDTPQRRVVIEVDRVGVAGLTKGRVVDVYAVRDSGGDASPPPAELVLAGVTVAEDVRSGGGTFGGSGTTAGVALLVDRGDVPALIDAVAHGSVYVVSVPSGSS